MRTFYRQAAFPALVILVATLLRAPGALADPGDIALASTSDTGEKGNDLSAQASSSADGSRVAFSSAATNLDPTDTDAVLDVYVKDLVTGDLMLASTSDAGVKGNGNSLFAFLSSDGTRVAFSSDASNLDPSDTDVTTDVYVKDLVTGDIMLASTSDDAVKGDGFSGDPTLSADGTRVAFASLATTLDPGDTDTVIDVYVKDLATGDLVLASTSDAGVKGNGDSIDVAAISDDGKKVGFSSAASNLDPADTDAVYDVYVKDLVTGDTTLVSTSDAGDKGNGNSFSGSLSADGGAVAFRSDSTNLDPSDTDTIRDVYVKNLVTGDITLASTSDTGMKGDAESDGPSLSDDGTAVGFGSAASNLDPLDTNQTYDVYVKGLITGDLVLASISDIGVIGNGGSVGPSLSADGRFVAFNTNSSNLVPADDDFIPDVYVKELGVAPPVECTITGTGGDDVLEGTRGDDIICGFGGNDRLDGGSGGDDVLLGGDGRDVLVGRSGADILRGEADNDILRTRDGVRGNDIADGGDGSDRCIIDRGDVVIDCP